MPSVDGGRCVREEGIVSKPIDEYLDADYR